MKVKVLKELPQGQQPGTVHDFHEDVVAALMLVGAVEPYEDPKPTRGTYKRRDLRAEDKSLTAAE